MASVLSREHLKKKIVKSSSGGKVTARIQILLKKTISLEDVL